MHLNRPVQHLQRHARCNNLDHRDFLTGHLVADGVHHMCRLQSHQPCLLDLDATACNVLADGIKTGQRLAKGLPGIGTLAHQLQSPLGDADRAHAVMDTARPKAALGNLEPPALAQQDVAHRHPHVFVVNLRMAMGSVVIAEHRKGANHFHARRIQRHQNHRLLLVLLGLRVGLAHHDGDLRGGGHGTGGPPLFAVDYVLVTLAADFTGNIGGIRRRDIRLGH